MPNNDASVKLQPSKLAFENVPSCPVCDATESRPIWRLEKFGHVFNWVECRTCGLSYQSPRLTGPSLAHLYQTANFWQGSTVDHGERILGYDDYIGDEEMRLKNERRKARFVSRLIRPGGRVLDIACGSGSFLRAAAEQGLATAGVEISEKMSGLALAQGFEVVAGDFEKVNPPHAGYDAITIWNADNIFADPVKTWGRIRSLLLPGGVFVINFLENSLLNRLFAGAFTAWRDCHSLYVPCRKSIRHLAARSGFVVGDIHVQWGHFALNRVLNVLGRLAAKRAPENTSQTDVAIRWTLPLLPMPGFFIAVMRSNPEIPCNSNRNL